MKVFDRDFFQPCQFQFNTVKGLLQRFDMFFRCGDVSFFGLNLQLIGSEDDLFAWKIFLT